MGGKPDKSGQLRDAEVNQPNHCRRHKQTMSGDKYRTFKDLAAVETLGEDYDFKSRRGIASHIVVIAPHGGYVEPWTDKIANAIAGKEFSVYCFRGLKKGSRLHIKSHRFDEPTCEALVTSHERVVAIHGWGAHGERVSIGGLDTELIQALKTSLAANGVKVEDASGPLKGTDPNNIANRGAAGRGVQFELTMAFRTNDKAVKNFTDAVRATLLKLQASGQR